MTPLTCMSIPRYWYARQNQERRGIFNVPKEQAKEQHVSGDRGGRGKKKKEDAHSILSPSLVGKLLIETEGGRSFAQARVRRRRIRMRQLRDAAEEKEGSGEIKEKGDENVCLV